MYTNRYSRKYPGLVVIVLDQSFAMREEYKGVSCITCATKVINTIIGELCLRNCDGVDIGNRVFVQIFEHGENEEVEESKSGCPENPDNHFILYIPRRKRLNLCLVIFQ